MRRKRTLLMVLFVLICHVSAQEVQKEARLLRFPAIYDDKIVFCYAGDLYIVSSDGGTARKLTSDIGYEMFPRFSPDGKWIAFTGQYDGNTEVYLMPADGGIPKRLTYTATLPRDDVSDRMGPNNIVMTWTNTTNKIVFRSRMHSFNPFIGQLYTVDVEGNMPEELPLPRGGFCSFSPDDKKLAYNRIFREFRTWKRYRGGMADDIWIYDFTTKKTINITNNEAQDIIPMWHGDKIYFLSDRDKNKRMNLYVYDLKTKETKQLTYFTDFDIKFPSIGKNAIVFEYGGYIYKYDLNTGECKKVPVYIRDDMCIGRDKLINVKDYITSFDISPDGKRAVFCARGDIFTLPEKDGITRNLTKTPGVHERDPVWSPDGKWIAFISDKTGEDEIYIVSQDGKLPPKQITRNAETYKYKILWSPDSRKLLWSDRRQRLRFVDISTGKITDVDQSDVWEIRDYSWSPDSKWIVYSKTEENDMNKIYVYSLAQNKKYEITEGWYSSYSPIFSDDGKYIVFISNREFKPIYSWTEWNHAYIDMAKIFLVLLTKDTVNPFKPENDEVQIKTSKSSGKSKKTKKQKDKEKLIKIDFDGIKDRIVSLPIKASRYRNISFVDNKIYYIRKGFADEKPILLMYDLNKKEEKQLGHASSYVISFDQKKMLVRIKDSYGIIDLPKSQVKIEKPLNLDNLVVKLNRKKEWEQIYNECWRQMREYFYAPNMHGVNWEDIKERYKPLVKYVNHRADLTYIIGEMIGELNVGHTYVGGGDYPKPKRIKLGLLGAQFEKDKKTGFFIIKKILKGVPWDKELKSPLMEPEVNAKEGEYVIAIDGIKTDTVNNIYKLLVGKADKQVKITLNSKPSTTGSREVIVVPIADESKLYYYNWVQRNIEIVNKKTNGKVGYVHIPDMSVEGLNEFVKHYYPQITKKALIVDVRGNGGGNVSPMIIERLRREIAMITIARNTKPSPNPDGMIWGPMVCLCDEYSASDGDIFTYRFKHYKLGKVIGKRTWGGVVGIRSSLPLVDGGQLYKPEFSRYDVEGKKWIIEGHGVEPDIYVDNDPALEYQGIDQQLNKAIEVILDELKTNEKQVPPPPPYPER